jgi:hypothetical protein
MLRAGIRRLVWTAATASAAALCAASAPAGATSGPPVVGVVKSGAAWVLRPLDAKTLQPLEGTWSRRVDRDAGLVRSPLGTGVAVNGARTLFVDSRTGRPLRSQTGTSSDAALSWFGGERFGRSGKARVLADFWEAGSLGYWVTYVDLASGGETFLDDEPWEVFPEGLVVWEEDTLAVVTGVGSDGFTGWRTLLTGSRYAQSAADIVHDRLYLLRRDGTIAEIDDVGGRPRVTYHHVDLNGKPFQAAWAGHGRIAIWGDDGLGTIDTRTWTTHALAEDVHAALMTRYGIVGWTEDVVGGVSV